MKKKSKASRKRQIALYQQMGFDEIYDPEAPDEKPGGQFLFSKTDGRKEWDFTTITIKDSKIAIVNILNHWGNATLKDGIIARLRERGATNEDIAGWSEEIDKRVSLQYQAVLPLKYLPVTYRADRNFLTFPIAVLGKPKPGQTLVSWENKKVGIKTDCGSMYGVLQDFDNRVFQAITALTQRIVVDGKHRAEARFTLYDIAKYLNLNHGGPTYKRIAEALKKIGAMTVSTTIFRTRDNTSIWTNQSVFYKANIRQKGDQILDNYFIWNIASGENFNNWFEVIDNRVLKQLGNTSGRLYCYLKRAMGRKGTHQETWESIADRLPLTGKNRADKKKTFIEACEELQVKAGITWKIDGKCIARFTSHPRKTKEDHQAEARAEVESRKDWNTQVKTLSEEQNKLWAKLILLKVDLKFTNRLVKSTIKPEYIWEVIRKMEKWGVKNPTAYLKMAFTLNKPEDTEQR